MEVMVVRNNQNNYYPMSLLKIMRGSEFPRNRMGDTIEELRYLARGGELTSKQFSYKYIKEHPGKIFSMAGSPNKFYIWNEEIQSVTVYIIKDLDPSIPWQIVEYPNGIGTKNEWIVFADKRYPYKVLNGKTGYSEFDKEHSYVR